MSLAIVLALAAALGAVGTIFTDASWWFIVVGIATFVVVAMAFTRALSRFGWLIPVVGLALLIECLVFAFASDVALLGFIPTIEVADRFRDLVGVGFESIAAQGIPARPDEGIIFLLTAGAGLLAIALDGLAITARRPALVGIPILALLALPTMFDPELFDPFYFFLTAAAYLLVLYVGIGEARSLGAISVGAGAIAFALIFPLVLPPTASADSHPPAANIGFSAGLDIFIDLGNDLRSPREVTVLTYTTTANHGQYLRISSVDSFSGPSWTASRAEVRDGTSIQQIGPPTGQAKDVAEIEETTKVKLTNYSGKLLPAPYAPSRIAGLLGDWDWDQNNLTISSPSNNERGENYAVTSVSANPTLAQLEAAGSTVPDGMDQYLRVPEGLDDIVGETARSVTANATSNFDKARLIEAYFKSGEFAYSEQAPVDANYDSGGAEVIGAFLKAKKGYCVHFAAAMAVMARELGIPSRISVGFTPGTFVQSDDDDTESYYAVTTKNLHAWPELYFDGIGWIRFEPTVSRGVQRTFDGEDPPPASAANPTSVPGEETAAPTAAPTATSSPSPTPDLAAGGGGTNLIVPQLTIGALVLGMLAVLLLPLLPLVVRTIRRLARYSVVLRRGSAVAAWQELQDTAVDLGWEGASMTPKEFAGQRHQYLSERALAALARLQAAIEATAFSPVTERASLRDLTTARAGFAQTAPRRDRWRAFITPRSVGSLRRQSKKQ